MVVGGAVLLLLARAALASPAAFALSDSSHFTQNSRNDSFDSSGQDYKLLELRAPGDGVVVPLKPCRNLPGTVTGYCISATIGSDDDKSNFKLLFDTGSPFLMVASDQLHDSVLEGTPRYEAPEKTCHFIEEEFGGGLVVNAMMVPDTVSFGNDESNKVEARSYKVGAINHVSDEENPIFKNEISGIFGASIDSNSWPSAALADTGFTVNLDGTASSSVNLGNLDESKAKGDIKWFPTTRGRINWEISSPDMEIPLLIDTGAPAIFLPQDKVEEYFAPLGQAAKRYPGENYYMVRCDQDAPDWTVKIGDSDFTVEGSLLKSEEVGNGWCLSFIRPVPPADPYSIIGVPFFHKYVVFFDVKDSRIGIAEKN